jgi:hypothetical protein
MDTSQSIPPQTDSSWLPQLFLVPIVICVVLNVLLVRALYSSTVTGIQITSDKREQESRTLVVRAVTIVTVFIILELPREVLNVIQYVFHVETPLLLIFANIMHPMLILNSVVNFYLYCLTGKRFRKICFDALRNLGRRN